MALDITTDPRFSRSVLTQAINVFPRQYGFLGQLGLFGPSVTPIDTTFVSIVKNNGGLALIPAKSRDGETNKNSQKSDRKITIEIPHLPLDDAISANDMQNLMTYTANTNNGMVDPAQTFQMKLNRQMQELGRKHDITHEYYRIQALNGYIKDADGSVLVDLYQLFGLTRANFQTNIDLGLAATDITGAMGVVNDAIEDKMSDDTIGLSVNGFDVTSFGMASPEFWRKLTSSAQAKEAYQFQQGLQNNPVVADLRKTGFVYGGTLWFNYNAKVTGTQFVPAGKAFVVPAGTSNTFEEYAAPANYNDTVNTLGEEKYAKIVEPNNKKGATLETQSNRLALAKRPDTLWEITDAA